MQASISIIGFLRILDLTKEPKTLLALLALIITNILVTVVKLYKNKELANLEELDKIDSENRVKILEMRLNDFGTTVTTEDIPAELKAKLIRKHLHYKTFGNIIKLVRWISLLLAIIIALYLLLNWDTRKNPNQGESIDPRKSTIIVQPKRLKDTLNGIKNKNHEKRLYNHYTITGHVKSSKGLKIWTKINNQKLDAQIDDLGMVSLKIKAQVNEIIRVNILKNNELKSTYVTLTSDLNPELNLSGY